MKLNLNNHLKTIARATLAIVFFMAIPHLTISQFQEDSLLNSTDENIILFLGADSIVPLNGNMTVAKIVGNARFQQGNILMRSEFALLNSKTQSLKAIGNVKINQADSVTIYGDSLDYNGETKIAVMRGNVRLIENDITLTSPSLTYNTNTKIAYYTQTGKVVSRKTNNTLTSSFGSYSSNSQTMTFKDNVVLKNPDYTVTCDTLNYNERSEIAYFFGDTYIKGEGNLIFCKTGFYDTKNDIAEFNRDAYLISDGMTIKGDKLYYDRKIEFAKAIGNISLQDSANQLIVTGDYGSRNEKTNYSMVTGHTLVSKWFEEEDTLFLTADTIEVLNNKATNTNNLKCFHKVRIYKNDLQGICDSMVYNQSDSVIKLFQNPYIWTENSQMNSDTIYIQLSAKSIKDLKLRNNSFIIDAVMITDTITNDTTPSGQYNQIKGKDINGFFTNDTIRMVYVKGNGQSIYYTQEDGAPAQALNKVDCSDMKIKFDQGTIEQIAFISQPKGMLLPIQDVKEDQEKLKGFNWKINERPSSKSSLLKE